MSAWYIETWVNAPFPVTSPTAQHARARDAQVVVDGSARARLVDADGGRPERAQVGSATGRDQQPLGDDRLAAADGDREPPAVVSDRLDRRGGHHPIPSRSNTVGEELARLGLLRGQQAVGLPRRP